MSTVSVVVAKGLSNALMWLGLAAQRHNLRLPDPIACRLRSWLDRLSYDKTRRLSVADCSSPLIARPDAAGNERGDASALGVAAPVPGPVPDTETHVQHAACAFPPAAAPKAATGSLRCVLATSSLDVGGMDEVVAFLARRLPCQGVRTTVLHASAHGAPDGRPTGRLGRLLAEHGVETVERDADAGTRWLAQMRPDVISAHDPAPWVLDAASRLSIPYVDTLHGMHSLFSANWAAEARRSRRLTRIVAVGELVRQQYLHGNPAWLPERIVTIPNGVNDQWRPPASRRDARARLGLRDEYLFVSLARHCLQKNSYGLVAAFADVAARHPDAHLVIAGRADDPAYFTQLLRLREALPCRDRIHLRDHTPAPTALLAAADSFVLDSFFEGWSLASMEALHAGVPVVLSEVGGAREQVGEGDERGHVVANPLGDPLRVDWQTIREARFARQVNRPALVTAMRSMIVHRALWLDAREDLARESAARFHPDVCLRRHAEVLAIAAAEGCPSVEAGAPSALGQQLPV